MYSMVFPTIAANLSTTGCVLLLLRRGTSRRLKLLTWTVGLMSLAQTAATLHHTGIWSGGSSYVMEAHLTLVACLSLLAIYLLGQEILDRNHTSRKLVSTERGHQIAVPSTQTALMVIPEPSASLPGLPGGTPIVPVTPRFYIGPNNRTVDSLVLNSSTADVLALAVPLGESVRPVPEKVASPES